VQTRLSMPLQRKMLAVLILRGGQLCGSAYLQDTVWGPGRNTLSHPETALRTCVYRLRAALDAVEPGRIHTESAGYMLEIRPAEDDVSMFRSRIKAGLAARDRQDFRAADRLLASALTLWGDPPLPDVPDTLNGQDLKRALIDEYHLAREAYYDVQLGMGRHADIVPELRAWTRDQPMREHAWAQLLVALYVSGQRAAAMSEYSWVRTLFIDELGAELGPELQDLATKISRDDPELMTAVTGRPAAWEPPCQLPAVDPGYVPDPLQAEAAIDRLRRPGPRRIVVVTGPRSSDFALAVAHRASEMFPDGQLYAPLTTTNGRPRMAADVLAGQLSSLGVPQPAIPRDEPDRANRFRMLLDRKSVLVFADRARNVGQVEPLIPGHSGSAVLVASDAPLAAGLGASLTIDLRQPAASSCDRPRVPALHEDRPLAVAMVGSR
jgi:DNA-binding SARP family transcriptional activator